MVGKRASGVWKYFEAKGVDSVCNICSKVIACKSCSTSGMLRHLLSIHKITIEPMATKPKTPGTNKKKSAKKAKKANFPKTEWSSDSDEWPAQCANTSDETSTTFASFSKVTRDELPSSSFGNITKEDPAPFSNSVFYSMAEEDIETSNINSQQRDSVRIKEENIRKRALPAVQLKRKREMKCKSEPGNQTVASHGILPEIIAKMAALDGIPISAIVHSSFIRDALANRGFKMLLNEAEVMQMILGFYKRIQNQMIDEIGELITRDYRFTLVVNECTRRRESKQYLDICLYGPNQKFFSLGIVCVPHNSQTIDVVERRLKDFNVNYKNHVVGTVMNKQISMRFNENVDEHNAIQKLVRNSPVEVTYCLNHGIHLAVLDVLYKNKKDTRNNSDHTSDAESENSNAWDSDDDRTADDSETGDYKINEYYEDAINATRNIIKFFKQDEQAYYSLKTYMESTHDTEVKLVLSSKRRWDSIVTMIETFLAAKIGIQKSLSDYNMSCLWNEAHIQILQSILDVLRPTKLAVEALARPDANLPMADAVLSTLFNKVYSLNTQISKMMCTALVMHLNARRNKTLCTLIKYLKNPDIYSSSSKYDQVIEMMENASKSTTISYAEEIFNRLFQASSADCSTTADDPISAAADDSDAAAFINAEDYMNFGSFEDELNRAIESAKCDSKSDKKLLEENFLQKEFQLYETCGIRTKNLENLYNVLISIKPTAAFDTARVFSVPGNFTTKISNHYSDKEINALVYLKSYFSNK